MSNDWHRRYSLSYKGVRAVSFSWQSVLRTYVKAGRICFKIIGRLDSSVTPYVNPFVQFHDPQVFYSKETFDRDVLALDGVLYSFPSDSYHLTASGSIFDAVKFNKAIVTSRNAYCEWVLRDVPEGYVTWFGNLDQIENVLHKWLIHGPPVITASAYDAVRVAHSLEAVGSSFARQLADRFRDSPEFEHPEFILRVMSLFKPSC